MCGFGSFAGLSPDQQEQRYETIARAALAAYDLGAVQLVFLQHNGGLVFRVESADRAKRYVLKIHEPVGTGSAATAEQIRARLDWLAGLSRATNLVVQDPIPNRAGELLTSACCSDLLEPLHCTLQRWVEGEHTDQDFTPAQAYQIGALLAELHDFSSQWMSPTAVSIPRYQVSTLHANIAALRPAIELGILSASEYARIVAAGQLIEEVIRKLGERPKVWGAIHGDLHHGNLLFCGNEIRPIDFDSLCLAHYHADLAITLYHILHQEHQVRRMLLEGYCSIRHLPEDQPLYLEAFVTSGAIDNLAFQISIPSQQITRLFARNMWQLANVFCGKLIEGQPFVFA
jgi:Ser/Thr protein kinase RdoA (MazF antagonist)